MSKERKIVVSIAAAIAGILGFLILQEKTQLPQRYLMAPIEIRGAVLRSDPDPGKQSPLGNAKVTASTGLFTADTTSDASGAFDLTLRPGAFPGRPIILNFEHAQYRPVQMEVIPENKLYIVRMEPLEPIPIFTAKADEKPVQIKDVKLRYSVQTQATVDVGTLAKQMQVVNTGNVPCNDHPPCSPDKQWKASIGTLTIDADARNLFRNVRVTCIGGPCPFTKIQNSDLSVESRKKTISVLNWSDTASFLVEAEVFRTVIRDTVRHSYPFIVGPTMTFALPIDAEGPSIEAEENGQAIVFPLGPNMILSWATCSVETSSRNKVFRCTLKPGYEFPE